jgi:hypothetical protein
MPTMAMRWNLIILVVSVALVSGCKFAQIAAMKITSVDVVSRTEQPVPDESKNWTKLEGKLLRITMQSQGNLRQAMNSFELHVGFEAWFCDKPQRKLSHMSYVYDSKGMLGEDRDITPPTDNITWLYVAVSRAATTGPQDGKGDPPYDLREKAEDVCLHIRARNMAKEGFESKLIRLPANVIESKLVAGAARDSSRTD